MTVTDHAWPPLIVAKNIPRAVRWRDFILTLAAWLAFAVLLDEEFALSLGVIRAAQGGGVQVRVDWVTYLERLGPFFLVAGVLVAALAVFSVRTLQRRSRALRLPPPVALETAVQARQAGLDEAELLALRDERIVVVGFLDAGALTIAAKRSTSE